LYADIIKIYNVGYGAILGRFSGVLNLFFTVATFLVVKGLDLGYIETLAIFIVVMIIIMTLGFLYLRVGLQKSEFSSNFREQPEMLEMMKDIKEIKNKLNQKEVVVKKVEVENLLL